MKPTPVQEAARAFRAKLLAGEDEASRALLADYGRIVEKLEPQLRAVLSEIHDEGASAARLFEKARLQKILAQVGEEMAGFANVAGARIQARQRELLEVAQRDGQGMARVALGDPPDDYSGPIWEHLPARSLEHLVGLTADSAPVDAELKKLVPNAVERVKAALVAGIGAGQTPAQITSLVRDELGRNAGRFLTVARTADICAYTSAQLEFYEANSDVVEAWRWMAALSFDTCPACLAMHGKIFPLGAPMNRHFNCRCMAVPVTKTWEQLGFKGIDQKREPWQSGDEWLRDQSEDEQKRVLGRGKWQLWKDGAAAMDDFVAHSHVSNWGTMLREAGVEEAKKNAGGGALFADLMATSGDGGAGGLGGSSPSPANPTNIKPNPQGKDIGTAVENRTGGVIHDHVEAALDGIRAVLNVKGPLETKPPIPVRLPNSRAEVEELEARDAEAGVTADRSALVVNGTGDKRLRPFVVVHEIGHHIDVEGVGTSGVFSSEGSPLLGDIMDAIEESDHIAAFRAAHDERVFVGGVSVPRLEEEERRYLAYLLQEKEMFARAFSQWVALRSGHPRLLEGLHLMQPDPNRLELPYPPQWTDTDFEPIAEAFDQVFRRLGFSV